MPAEKKDLYERFELQVRTPKRRVLLDAFLPAPETFESTVTPEAPPPLAVPDMTPEEINMFRRREPEEDEPPPEPRRKARPKKKGARQVEESRSLQDEIAEFMGRDGKALAPDDDLSTSIDNALDPKPGPDKKD